MTKNNKNTVRISGGTLRGRLIKTPGGATHPMGERERIALFNMIQDRIAGNYVLDLYAGGGTLGIEALSRGANFCMMIDKSPEAVEVANQNLRELDIYGMQGLMFPGGASSGAAMQGDVALIARTATDRYGIVIADPPYDDYSEKMVKYLPRLVLDGGVLVLSHPGDAPELQGVNLTKSHSYANATISIYVKN